MTAACSEPARACRWVLSEMVDPSKPRGTRDMAVFVCTTHALDTTAAAVCGVVLVSGCFIPFVTPFLHQFECMNAPRTTKYCKGRTNSMSDAEAHE